MDKLPMPPSHCTYFSRIPILAGLESYQSVPSGDLDCRDGLTVTTQVAVPIMLTLLKSVSQQVLCRRFAEAPCIARTLQLQTM